MPRLTTLMLAGALGWPAVACGQVWGPPPSNEAPAATRPVDPASSTPAPATPSGRPVEQPAEEAFPAVPPLPPSGPLPASVGAAMPSDVVGASQRVDELPKPTPTTPAAPTRIPDVTGMPPARPGPGVPVPPPVRPNGHGVMLPGTLAPTIPPVCCPPEPPICTTCNESGFFVFGDLMMLRARQSNPVAVIQRVDQEFTPVITNVAVQYNTDHTGAWRAGGGYLTDDGWIFMATFTQYKDLVSEQRFVAPDLSAEFATVEIIYTGPGQLSGSGTGADEFGGGSLLADWNVQLRTVDLVVGTVFSPSDCFDLTVSAGVRMAWLDQDYRVLITSATLASESEVLALDLRGAGPHVTTEARVYVAPWFALYGRSSASLLIANRKDHSQVVELDEFGFELARRITTYDREEITPVFEIGFGGELSCLGGCLLINAGYEIMYWYELATSAGELTGSTAREPNHADISFDGAYLRVTLLF